MPKFLEKIPVLRSLWITHKPDPAAREFLERAQTQDKDGIEVTLAVLDGRESRLFFGVPMAKRGIQPVWLRIANHSQSAYRLHVVGIDPNYFSPYEAAAANHYSSGKRLLSYGLLAWLFLPLLVLLPIKLLSAWRANRKMDAYFQEFAFHLRPIFPRRAQEGFVFTPLDAGNKVVTVRLFGADGSKEFVFTVAVSDINPDHVHRDFEDMYPPSACIECDVEELRRRLEAAPRATSNLRQTREGDPVNLIVIGEFETMLSAFGARWDETESITLKTCWRTFRAFLLGSQYRYSPVSPLFLFGRSQDFALQRIRKSINERLHLRLWTTELRFRGTPVWIGQISRDIGVRYTWRTWNLTTHRVDPDVDEARDYVVEDLLQASRLDAAAYVEGVGACDRSSPRRNLTGDPYFSDGQRAVVIVSKARTTPRFIALSAQDRSTAPG